MHVDVSRANFHSKAQRPVLVKLPAEDCSGKDEGKNLTAEEEHVRNQRCSNWARDWQGRLGNWRYEVVGSSRNLFHNKKKKTSGLTHVVARSKKSLLELKKQLECFSNKSEHHRGRFGKERQGTEPENMLGRDKDILST